LGLAGIKSLSILREEAAERLLERAIRMTAAWSRDEAERAIRQVECDDSVLDLDCLSTVLARHVLNPSGRFAHAKLVCVDSVQGNGLATAADAGRCDAHSSRRRRGARRRRR
jgi:hypothetical protein